MIISKVQIFTTNKFTHTTSDHAVPLQAHEKRESPRCDYIKILFYNSHTSAIFNSLSHIEHVLVRPRMRVCVCVYDDDDENSILFPIRHQTAHKIGQKHNGKYEENAFWVRLVYGKNCHGQRSKAAHIDFGTVEKNEVRSSIKFLGAHIHTPRIRAMHSVYAGP